MLSKPIQVTLKVIKAFERPGIPYLIDGSLASAIHGIVRATCESDAAPYFSIGGRCP